MKDQNWLIMYRNLCIINWEKLQVIRISYFLILLSITTIFSKVNGSNLHFKWIPENSCAAVGKKPWRFPDCQKQTQGLTPWSKQQTPAAELSTQPSANKAWENNLFARLSLRLFFFISGRKSRNMWAGAVSPPHWHWWFSSILWGTHWSCTGGKATQVLLSNFLELFLWHLSPALKSMEQLQIKMPEEIQKAGLKKRVA